jgi:hypothetical protein
MIGTVRRFGWVLLAIMVATPAAAQIEDQLSAYTGKNAQGYLQPLADAFGANLNDGWYHSAAIQGDHLNLSLEVRVMAVLFSDGDREFAASTEDGFSPFTTVKAPTVVGSGTAKTVSGDGGTTFSFPGGFDLNSFAIAVPQLQLGTIHGTQALVRFFAMDTGDTELGNISLFGIGVRHSVSQYLGPLFPVDIAAGFIWQTFSLGDKLIDSNAFSMGAQASKRFQVLEPYAGLSVDTFSMDVEYTSDAGGTSQNINMSFDSNTSLHFTLGLSLRLLLLNAFGEYNIAGQNSFSFGLGFGI